MVKVLLVEDEDFIREVLREFLCGRGYEVTEVRSGEEAVDISSAGKFDVGLLDLKLPGMDGIEVAKRLREVDPDIVTIIMTGYPSLESVVEATREGVHDYIVKPFRLVELERTLERAIEERRRDKENKLLKEKLAELEGKLEKYQALERHRPFERAGTSLRLSEAQRRYRRQSRWPWRRSALVLRRKG